MSINFSNKYLRITIASVAGIIILVSYLNSFAGTFTCTSNVCTGSDSFTFSESNVLNRVATLIGRDTMIFSDKISGFITNILKFTDGFAVKDFSILKTFIATVTTTITQIITQISTGCSGSNCFVNPNANSGSLELIAEQIIFPTMMILGTVFGFMYMGLRYFGVMVMVGSFILLGLAYIGIIPSYFTLLTIIMVGAAMTKLLINLFGNNGAE